MSKSTYFIPSKKYVNIDKFWKSKQIFAFVHWNWREPVFQPQAHGVFNELSTSYCRHAGTMRERYGRTSRVWAEYVILPVLCQDRSVIYKAFMMRAFKNSLKPGQWGKFFSISLSRFANNFRCGSHLAFPDDHNALLAFSFCEPLRKNPNRWTLDFHPQQASGENRNSKLCSKCCIMCLKQLQK